MYAHELWKVNHKEHPDVTVDVEGFSQRGVILKARCLLASQGIATKKTDINEYHAERKV